MRKIISIIDDDAIMLQFLGKILQSEYNEVQLFSSPKQFISIFDKCLPNIIISDLLMPEMDGLEILRYVRTHNETVPFIMLTTEAKVQTAIQAMKEGVIDYITKPIDTQEFRLRIERAYEFGKLRQILQTNIAEKQNFYAPDAIVGESKTARKSRELVLAAQVGPQPPLWLVGEKGVGKRFLAHALHYAGTAANAPYVEFDCQSITDEGELRHVLFGQIQSLEQRDIRERGLLEQVGNGTLVLLNPDSMPYAIQHELAKCLISKEIRPDRAAETIPLDTTLLCLSSSEERYEQALATADKDFLACFEDRAHILQPLRKRKEDVIPLAEYCLAQESTPRHHYTLSEEAAAKLMNYNWNANVSELILTMKRGVRLCDNTELMAKDVVTGYSTWTIADNDAVFQIPQGMQLKEVQGEYVRQTLEFFEGNLEKAAKSLGVSRKTLWEVRKKFNLP